MLFNTHLHAKHNNLRLKTFNPLKWEYHLAMPKIYHAKSEDYFKKDVSNLNKDDYAKQNKSPTIDPRNIIISDPVNSSTTGSRLF